MIPIIGADKNEKTKNRWGKKPKSNTLHFFGLVFYHNILNLKNWRVIFAGVNNVTWNLTHIKFGKESFFRPAYLLSVWVRNHCNLADFVMHNRGITTCLMASCLVRAGKKCQCNNVNCVGVVILRNTHHNSGPAWNFTSLNLIQEMPVQ